MNGQNVPFDCRMLPKPHPLWPVGWRLDSNREHLSSAHPKFSPVNMAAQKYCLSCACPCIHCPGAWSRGKKTQRGKLSWDRALPPTECQGPFVSRNVSCAVPRNHRTHSRFSITNQSNPQAAGNGANRPQSAPLSSKLCQVTKQPHLLCFCMGGWLHELSASGCPLNMAPDFLG